MNKEFVVNVSSESLFNGHKADVGYVGWLRRNVSCFGEASCSEDSACIFVFLCLDEMVRKITEEIQGKREATP